MIIYFGAGHFHVLKVSDISSDPIFRVKFIDGTKEGKE